MLIVLRCCFQSFGLGRIKLIGVWLRPLISVKDHRGALLYVKARPYRS